MSEEIKFDLDGDIIMQIEMDSYMKYNDTIASMNDHLGEIYGYSDVRNTEEAQLKYEKELAYKAIVQLQQKVEQLENENFNIRENIHLERISLPPELTKDKNFMELYDIPSYEDLQQKVEELEKENKELNRMCELYGQSLYNADLTKAEKRVEQLENIRKEAIRYLENNQLYNFDYDKEELFEIVSDKIAKEYLLNILNKGSEE